MTAVRRLLTHLLLFAVPTAAWARDAQASHPVFDPNTLDVLRGKATADICRQLDALRPEALSEAARAFFAARDGMSITLPEAAELEQMVAAYRTEQVLAAVHAALKAAYPQHVVDRPVWIWNNVGGIYARMAILACGLSEYVALFGTNVPQQGFSGYHTGMDVWDIMVTGSMWSYGAASTAANPLRYTPGERVSVLPRRETRYYTMDAFTYMIDYGRGSIARAFWQGILAPYFFINHDWESLKTQLGVCAERVMPFPRRRASG
jgi:hypothetical protein